MGLAVGGVREGLFTTKFAPGAILKGLLGRVSRRERDTKEWKLCY